MMTLQYESKYVQTDPYIGHSRSELLKLLKTYLIAVIQHRLRLFNQYTQSDDCFIDQALINVRRKILNRFEWTIIELEQAIESLQRNQLSVIHAQEIIDRPLIKEVIEASVKADLSSVSSRNIVLKDSHELQMYRRNLQEAKEDFITLDMLLHRGISKIDHLVNSANVYN